MKKVKLNLIGIYFFSYFALAALLPLIAQYLLGIGLNGLQIGTIMGFGMFTGVIAAPLWGMLCDRVGRNKKILYILMLCPATLSLIIMFYENYYAIVALYGCFFIFQNSIFPVTDALTLKFTSNFGKIRLWGSLGFAIGVFITGIIAHKIGLRSIFIIYSTAVVIAALFLKNVHEEKIIPLTDHKFKGIGELLRNKPYIIFVLASIFSQGPMVAHNTYFSILFTQAGGNIAGFGLVLMMCTASEAPMMQWVHKLQEKFYAETILIVTTIISILRWYWYSTMPSPNLLLGTFFLQGFVTGIFIALGLQYVAAITKKENRATAITVYCSMSMGVGAMICQFLGGIILDYYGAGAIYFSFSILNIIAFILFIILWKTRKTKIV